MKSKKIIIIALVILLSITVFAACKPTPSEACYTLVVPDGAPALAVANLPSHIVGDNVSHKIERKVVPSSNINEEAIKDDVDIAIVPANIAAIIFNANGGYKMLAVVTNGNLYMTSSIPCEVGTLQDLKGKMVYSIGQSSVPDMIFKTLLDKAGVSYAVGEEPSEGKVTIKYCKEGNEVISQLTLAKSKGQLAFGLYAEPAVTNSMAKVGFEEVFDLQSLWAQIEESNQSGYAQAVLIARDKVCEDSEFVAKLLEAFAANESAILQDPAKSVENIKAIYPQSALQANMTSQVIGRCNIKTVKADATGRAYYENTLKAILTINANLIGGKLPSDDFYIA
ncbi:MAG: hypothetical protein K2L61_02630 [Clostridia bacterium]|nr:hypothetical protein [Clostridia bacterium]